MRSHCYYALVHQDDDSAFGIQFPDIEGVFSAADAEEDIVSNAIEALRLFAEEETLPAPRNFNQIRKDPDVAAELAGGAVLVRVPLVQNDDRTVRVNITLDAGTIRAIDAAVRERGTNRSAFIAHAARAAIEK